MPTNRQVQLGDQYYCEYTKSVFTVVSQIVAETSSWMMSSGDDGHTMFMHQNALDQGDWNYVMSTGPDFKVVVGSTWFSVGYSDLFKVVRDSSGIETGPDSWEMKSAYTGRTLYMHHGGRVRGDWLHVSIENTLEPVPVVRRSRYHRTPVI